MISLKHILKLVPQSQRELAEFEIKEWALEMVGERPKGHHPDEMCCDECDFRDMIKARIRVAK